LTGSSPNETREVPAPPVGEMALELSLASASPPAGGGLAQPPPLAPPGKEQQVAGVGILLQISMLVLSFVLGHVLRRHRFYYLPEASASLLIGTYAPALRTMPYLPETEMLGIVATHSGTL
jgi:hypothetical protein